MTAPTDETLRGEVAKALGWTDVRSNGFRLIGYPKDSPEVFEAVPDYTSSLDACREFEQTLSRTEQARYAKHIDDMTGACAVGYVSRDYDSELRSLFTAINASAYIKCCAFLATRSPGASGVREGKPK